jgi:hypothetical protein
LATLGGNGTFGGGNTFGTLNLNGVGATYKFASNKTETFTTALNIIAGTGVSPSFMKSSTPGTQATISMASGSLCTNYLRLTDIKAIGGATFTAGPNSQNISNNTGWTFISGVPNPTVSITASANSCLGNPITFTAAFTNGGLLQTFQWLVNGVLVQNSPSTTFTTSTLADRDAVYCVISAFPTSCPFSLVVNSNTLNMSLGSVTPAVSISASASSISSGTSVTFTATPSNGGSTPAYQWKKNGINVSTNSDTYVDASLANNDVISCIITSSLSCVTSPTGTSNNITMTVTGPPSVQATNVTFSNTTSTSTTIGWTNGNGAARAVFVLAGSSGSPLPLDNTTYTANTVFGSGSQIGSSGWYCVYVGTGTSVNITGLSGSNYQVMAVEYNGAAGVEQYLTSTAVGNPNSLSGINAITKASSSPSNAASVQYTVTFGAAITGLTASNFSLTTSGAISSAGISSLSGSGDTYTVTVNTGSGDGNITLNLANSTGISPSLTSSLPFAGETYVISRTAPTVSSITRVGNTLSKASSNQFTVTFSSSVTGVDASDFAATTSGSVAATNIAVSGSGANYTVTISGITGDGTLRLDLNNIGTGITDNIGNAIASGFTSGQVYIIDQTGPAVASVSVPADAIYTNAQNLNFTVNFSEVVTVNTAGGIPAINISLNSGGPAQAAYLSGSGTTALQFSYTVATGQEDLDGLSLGSISLNGGTLKDAAGNNASLTLNNIANTANVRVDALSPAITSVAVPANGTYIASQNLDFTVNFSEVITVNTGGGTPYISITFNTGGTVNANYISGSGSKALLFRYTITTGKNDPDGISIGAALSLNGGTLKDASANNATLTLNSVGNTAAVLVDAVAPTVTNVSSTAFDGAYSVGASLPITITFNETVFVTGTPQLTLETGIIDRVINYTSGSGTSTLTFNYTVQSGDESSDLDYLSVNALALNGGTIKDAATNNATLSLPAPGAAGSLGANKAIIVSSTLPVVLNSYTAKLLTNGTVQLAWDTFSELNNDYFEVFKSIDGISFKSLAQVNGQGNSTSRNAYALIDYSPEKGINYYQLIQVNKDGSKKELGIKSVNFDLKGEQVISLYPNPASDIVFIKIDSGVYQKAKLITLDGKTLQTIIINKENNQISFKVNELSPATYLIRLYNNNQISTIKFIKN